MVFFARLFFLVFSMLAVVACGGGDSRELTQHVSPAPSGSTDDEAADTDGEEISENTDPFTSLVCYEEAGGTGTCGSITGIPQFTPDQVLADDAGVIYLLSLEHRAVFRWSTKSESYLDPIYLGNENLVNSLPLLMTYSGEHQRLYFRYEDGEITYADLLTDAIERPFARPSLGAEQLVAIGNFLLVQSDGLQYFYDRNGSIASTQQWGYSSLTWDRTRNRIYLLDSVSLSFKGINLQTGEVTDEGKSRDVIVEDTSSIRVSVDGQLLLLSNGEIYDADNLSLQGRVEQTNSALWLNSGNLLLAKNSTNRFELLRVDRQNRFKERVFFDGNLIDTLRLGDKNIILSRRNSELVFSVYTANNDSDGDSVANDEDAFPADVAASLDSDYDGFPDAWNEGYIEADSTTGLTLDVFPQDSSCWLVEHVDDSNDCDFPAAIPAFTPDAVVIDGNGVIYLFSTQRHTLYRWSAATKSILNPIYIGTNQSVSFRNRIKDMVYSSAHQRFYFTYDNGEITYLNLLDDVTEYPFARTEIGITELAAVGEFLLVQESDDFWTTLYLFDVNGHVTYSEKTPFSRDDYTFNGANNRVYYSGGFGCINYYQIDQLIGKINDSARACYELDSHVLPSFSVISQGEFILSGNGEIYDAGSLEQASSIPGEFKDVAAFENIFSVSRELDGSWFTELYNNGDFSFASSQAINGKILALLQYNDELVVVESNGGKLSFSVIATGNLGTSD